MLDKIKSIIRYEILRYKSKGKCLVIGILMLFNFFYFYPKFSGFLYSQLINMFDKKTLLLYGTIMIHLFSFFLYNIVLSVIYYLENPSIEKYKCNKNAWPWQEDKKNWQKLIKESQNILILNLLIIGPSLAYLSNLISPFKFRTDLESLPNTFEFTYQLLICFILNDFLFHFSHKLLHNSYLYNKIHYVHHRYNNPIGISAEYAHPIEYIMGNILPAALGPFILQSRMHILTLWAWTIFGIGATVEQHSGYDFPFSPYGIIPFSFSSSYHDYHHTRFKHNYSSNFIFWDTVFGNNSEYFNYLEKIK